MPEEKQHLSLKKMVDNQIARVLRRGNRAERFDQLRSRHFWSSYLFLPDPVTLQIPAGAYDIFKVIPSGTGQGYPTNVPLTLRETNWLNSGRVPDNQNFVITEIGVTLKRPPATDINGLGGTPPPPAAGFPTSAPSNGIWANLPAAMQALINNGAQAREINASDANAILYGGVLEMSFLTNNVPLGLLADFSQSAGNYVMGVGTPSYLTNGGDPTLTSPNYTATDGFGDPVNGLPAAAFRRKLEVPILLQHGENMGMRINFNRPIVLTPTTTLGKLSGPVGCGWFEIRVDWWAHESFVEKS
jgi:hypothetical protein